MDLRHSKNVSCSSLSRVMILSALIVLVMGLFFNSLGNLFTNWDDAMIYGNLQIRSLSWSNLLDMFTPKRASTYQPVRVLSYAIDYHFWKLNPVGYHLTNILFYILTCIMVYFTLRRLSLSLRREASSDSHERTAFFGSLLFAAHPVHVEAVTWLAARKEVLQGFFFFFAFYLYIVGRDKENGRRMIHFTLVLFLVLLAILSKPSAVVFPFVILIYEIAREQKGWFGFLKSHRIFMSLCLVASAIFIFILMKVMFEAGGIKPYHGGSFSRNILVSFYVFWENIKLLISTINYSAAYTFSVTLPIYSMKNILLLTMTFLLAGFSLFSLRWTKVVFFSFFFFLVTLLPYLNIIPISTLLADRYVFIASFSYAFLMGILFDRFYRYQYRKLSEGFFKLLSVAFFLFLLIGYSLMTIRQNTIWENSYTLWADAVEKHPGSNPANALMGVVYLELGLNEKAMQYLERAIQLLPYDYQSRNNLGIVCGKLDQFERGIKEFMAAIRIKPDDDAIKINLGVLYERRKEYRKAEAILDDLIEKNPKNANLYFRKGLLYKEEGKIREAISEFKRSIEFAPDIINPYEEIGNIYLNHLDDTEKATFYYLKGIEAAPGAKSKVEELRRMIQDLECYK